MLRPLEALEPERRLGPTQTLQSDKCAQCGEQSCVAGTWHVARVCGTENVATLMLRWSIGVTWYFVLS